MVITEINLKYLLTVNKILTIIQCRMDPTVDEHFGRFISGKSVIQKFFRICFRCETKRLPCTFFTGHIFGIELML